VKLLVADAGPLIIMARSRCVELLTQVAGEVMVTQTVYAECVAHAKPGAAALKLSVRKGLIRLIPDAPLPEAMAQASLDPGERSVIAAALAISCAVLIDDRKAREVAKRQGLAVIGSAGVLLKCKETGLVAQIRPILDQWRSFGYFVSDDLLKRVLELAGESA
jgi:uncharacterized protein